MVRENSVKITGVPNGTAGHLNGDHLIGEVLRNVEEGLFRIRGKTVVPSVYRLYLNPEDYDPLRDVVPFIVEEIRAALDEQLARWNCRGARLRGKLLGRIGGRGANPVEYVRLAEAWVVEIHPDVDGKLAPGEIEIYSELAEPQKRHYGAGSMTRRIFPREMSVQPVDPAPNGHAFGETPPAAVPSGGAGNVPVRAYLRFNDEHGPHVFEVTRNQVVIGRGGRSWWVDLRLDTLPDVSREHCRIRRNPESGSFAIEDVSQFGTCVDGKPVGQNSTMQLPPRAIIGLAGVIELHWEMV